jgi:hypothetical protein
MGEEIMKSVLTVRPFGGGKVMKEAFLIGVHSYHSWPSFFSAPRRLCGSLFFDCRIV